MPFVTVASAKDVEPGRGTLVEAGGRKLALFLHDGHYYALDNTCPHRGASLAQGTCENGELHCPLHDTRFELATGRHLCPPAKSDVRSYPVRVDGDDIQVEVDSLGSAAPPPALPRAEGTRVKRHSTPAAPSAAAATAVATAPSDAEAEAHRKKRVRVDIDDTPVHLTGPGLFTSGLLLGLIGASVAWGFALYLKAKASDKDLAQLREELEVAKQSADAPADPLVKEQKDNPEEVKRVQQLGDELVEDLRLQRIDAIYARMTPEYQKKYTVDELRTSLQKVSALKWVVESPVQRKSIVRRTTSGKGYDYFCTTPLVSSIGLLQIFCTFVPSASGTAWQIERMDFAQEK